MGQDEFTRVEGVAAFGKVDLKPVTAGADWSSTLMVVPRVRSMLEPWTLDRVEWTDKPVDSALPEGNIVQDH